MDTKVKPREVERLRSEVSRPASDTDDTIWEELLQGPDTASSGSSDSEGDGRCGPGLTLPPFTTLSSDDETLLQVGPSTRTHFNHRKGKYISAHQLSLPTGPSIVAAGVPPIQRPGQCHHLGAGGVQESRYVSTGDQWDHPYTGTPPMTSSLHTDTFLVELTHIQY